MHATKNCFKLGLTFVPKADLVEASFRRHNDVEVKFCPRSLRDVTPHVSGDAGKGSGANSLKEARAQRPLRSVLARQPLNLIGGREVEWEEGNS